MTTLSVSTHWIAHLHDDGSAMIDAINDAGFTNVELGYDTLPHLVPGIEKAVADQRVSVRSLHNFCPVPDTFSKGHPELFSLSSLNDGERQSAVYHTRKTITFAASLGSTAVVSHAGNVSMRRFTEKFTKLYNKDKTNTPRYDRLRAKASETRRMPAMSHFSALCRSVEELLPTLEELQIKLAFENLPSFEAIPSIEEQEALFEKFPSPYLCYWHDFGHAQVMQNLRLAPHVHRLQRFHARTAGVHIHDTAGTEDAHIMPPMANGIHWEYTDKWINHDWCLVLEPRPGTTTEEVQTAVQFLENIWQLK